MEEKGSGSSGGGTIRISGLKGESIVDCPGIRFAVFVQGCPHRCEGCHNPETHDFGGGYDCSVPELTSKIRSSRLITGLTLSGGEPFCQSGALVGLCEAVKRPGFSIAVYSGWTFEELLEKSAEEPEVGQLMAMCDILVDGRFVLSERTLTLPFRGSRNQRMLDLPASLKAGAAVILTGYE